MHTRVQSSPLVALRRKTSTSAAKGGVETEAKSTKKKSQVFVKVVFFVVLGDYTTQLHRDYNNPLQASL